jgi:hypothetical protein
MQSASLSGRDSGGRDGGLLSMDGVVDLQVGATRRRAAALSAATSLLVDGPCVHTARGARAI